MTDWEQLRELAHEVTPPDFAALERTARHRQHRARAAVGALAALLLVGGGIGIASLDDAHRDTGQPVKDPTRAPGELQDGVHALPANDAGQDYATLAAGRYRIALGDDLGFDVDLSDGTSAHDDGLFLSSGEVVLKVELAGDAYGVPADPCTGGILPTGPSVDDLVTAMTDLPVYQVSDPEPVHLGSADGVYLEVRIPRSYDASACSDNGSVQLPGMPETAVGGAPPYHGRWWVLDVHGHRVVIQQNCWDCTAAQLDRAANDPATITFTSTQ